MIPTREQEIAVLRAVVYASLFDYPLTLAQLRAALVQVEADEPTVAGWWRDSPFLQAAVDYRDGLFFPAGRDDLVATRARRETLSRDLLSREHRVLRLVAGMPFVRMVAVSGSLAHLNAETSADLDLFVITAPHRVWCVTLSLLVIARLLGWRRRMCLNYVISEQALAITPADLFSANQIIHLRPIAGHDVFARFIDANPFVRAFYPNFEAPRPSGPQTIRRSARMLNVVFAPLERLSRWFYGRHLLKQSPAWRSREQVRLEPECLKLHTTSHRADTLARFEVAMARVLSEEREGVAVR